MDQPTQDLLAPAAQQSINRRQFLKYSSGGLLTLSLGHLSGTLSSTFVSDLIAGTASPSYHSPEDVYQKTWAWDAVTFGSHTNACLPAGCSFHVYVKDGIVWREEQQAKSNASNPDYPDYNPLGCQKGCSFHHNIYGDERVKYPLKRVGERGSGEWQRITWDEALTEVAGALIDSMETVGSDGFVLDPPHFHCGQIAWAGMHRLTALLSGVCPDLNMLLGDFYKGNLDTLGKQHVGYSADNLYDSELILLSCTNWSYTMTPIYHFLTEARYNGTEVIMLAPDYNPSTHMADIHVPVKVGTDSAFWLAASQVMIEENLIDIEFVKSQTDQPLLVRTDTGRFLRAIEVDGGREDQLYVYDLDSGQIIPAPRGTLKHNGDPALEGSYQARLADGSQVTVRPAFEALKTRLNTNYTPEQSSPLCGVHPSLIREVARKVAAKITGGYMGYTSAKYYHNDLMERAMLLAMALSGNWGKPGTGWSSYVMPVEHIEMLVLEEKPAAEGGLVPFAEFEHQLAAKLKAEDPDVSDELISIEATKLLTKQMGVVPPVFWLYHHCGYKDYFDNENWQDASLPKSFPDYMQEAIDKGWWTPDQIRPAPEITPQVLGVVSSNPLRRLRSGAIKYVEDLFPKLKMLFVIEPRMSYTAAYADIVLPAAWYYEKVDNSIVFGPANPQICMIEQAVEPAGEAKPEWEIYVALAEKLVELAAQRGLTSYSSYYGEQRNYADIYNKFTMDGRLLNHEQALNEILSIAAMNDTIPPGYTADDMRKDGHVKLSGMGNGMMAKMGANEYDPGKPFYSMRWHVEEQKIYPTYTRRAQFYIDHEWYLEAGEHLPMFKETPPVGGAQHPFKLTGGHPRHSVHSSHQAQPALMKLHRGSPVVHINDQEALEMGLQNGEMVRVFNDIGDFEIMLRTSPSVQPKQAIIYMWEGYQFKGWKVYDSLLGGLPKPLHFAGGYGQLTYYFYNGGPSCTTDRGTRVSIEKARI